MFKTIVRMSDFLGKTPEVALHGGSAACKDEKFLYTTACGVGLANAAESDLVKLDRAVIRDCFAWDTAADADVKVKGLLAYAAAGAQKKPSMDALLHEVVEYTYSVHFHSALVNGMTCGKLGAEKCAELFPNALWVEYAAPGYAAAKALFDKAAACKKANGKAPELIFLQNHGVIVGGNEEFDVVKVWGETVEKLQEYYTANNVDYAAIVPGEPDMETVMAAAPLLRGLLAEDGKVVTVKSCGAFTPAAGALTACDIRCTGKNVLACSEVTAEAVQTFEAASGVKPAVVCVPGKAVFAAGKNAVKAAEVLNRVVNAVYTERLTAAFGGAKYLSSEECSAACAVTAANACCNGNSAAVLAGKVAIVTGGAQGFGYGIAEVLAAAGADVVIADMNVDGANAAAAKLGAGASGAAVNIADEDSVAAMVAEVVKNYGGADLFVANAGVLRAGSVKSLSKKDWDFVTNINYSGYFLCVKHIAPVMALQNSASNGWCDIVQVNSKSGLVGSNRNGAYAGSKFGTIGLTQSFALELVTDRIKVNSVCPGNFFDGPLWSDPEKGLFVQYLNAGKVPGAKTVADVKEFYEKQIPMHRGCLPVDVAKAIIYAVEQLYETGQAIPVSGGQVMLN